MLKPSASILSRNGYKTGSPAARVAWIGRKRVRLVFPGHVEVGDRPLGDLGGEEDGLGQRRMRVDGKAEIVGVCPHLQRQHRLGDQLAGIDADYRRAEEALRGLVEQELGQPL